MNNKWRRVMGVVAGCAMAVSATAQTGGVPVASGADRLQVGTIRVSVGAAYGVSIEAANERDVLLYGGRFEYGLRGGWSLHADLGMMHPGEDEWNMEADRGFAGQVGAQYALPRPWDPFDTAIRGSVGWASYSDPFGADFHWITLSLGAVFSKNYGPWESYGLLGIRLLREEERFLGTSNGEWRIAPAAGIGATYDVIRDLALYGEVLYVGGVWVGAGARWTF